MYVLQRHVCEAIASTSGRKAPTLLFPRFSRACRHATNFPSRSGCIVTAASSSQEVGQQFEGIFGKWTLDENDKKEVLAYRAGLTVAAIALVLDTGISLLPEGSSLREGVRGYQNVIAVAGASGLGASYALIHIYVTPLKRFLQALFVLGTLGSLYLMLSQDMPVTEYVANHRGAIWLVGPLFASVTGLGIKEGLCYGTAAAAGITLVTPALCLGHLSGLIPESGTKGLLVALNVLVVIFAAGKYGQPIQGDIGDKSVFEVQALPKEEQERRWAALKEARAGDGQL